MVQKLIDKAAVLVEALPYIRRFYEKTIVIKCGGNAMADDDLRDIISFGLPNTVMKGYADSLMVGQIDILAPP